MACGEREAAVEVAERGGGVAGAGGEGAEEVVGLAERARVAGLLGQRAGLLGELGGARRIVVVVGGEAEVGGDAGAGAEVGRGAAASAASKCEVASARSPRRWWTWPIRCSMLASSSGGQWAAAVS